MVNPDPETVCHLDFSFCGYRKIFKKLKLLIKKQVERVITI